MRYFYEYKHKNGSIVGGHNLELITSKGNDICLIGVDIIQTYEGYEEYHWSTVLDMREIEYLKITPMESE